MSDGILYIASGAKYLNEAKRSVKSVKTHNDIRATLITDREVHESCFDTIHIEDDFGYHYGDSVMKIPSLPYDRTLLLDTDTRIYGNITGLFKVLDEFDIAASVIADSEYNLSDDVPETFPEYNTGVVSFRKSAEVQKFIDQWQGNYQDDLSTGTRMNQPSFRETLYKSNIRIATIPTEFNCRINFGGYLQDDVKVLHGDIDNPDEIIKVLNEYNMPRVYYNSGSGVEVNRIGVVRA
jgi:hypothetical protein